MDNLPPTLYEACFWQNLRRKIRNFLGVAAVEGSLGLISAPELGREVL